MPNKRKLGKQKEAANFVAGLILNSLDQFPEKERKTRLNDIHKILKASPDRGKLSKRSATPRSPRVSRRASAQS